MQLPFLDERLATRRLPDNMYQDKTLLNNIDYLKSIIHQVLEEQVGKNLLTIIDNLSSAGINPIKGAVSYSLSSKLFKKVAALNLNYASQVIQAYAINFQLINIAEENFGMQDRRRIQRQGRPVPGSIEECVNAFKKKNLPPERIQIDR